MSQHEESASTSSRQLPFVEAAIAAEQDPTQVRDLSVERRAELLAAVCRDAAQLEQSKIECGLSPSLPAPWPAATWEFLRRATDHFRR